MRRDRNQSSGVKAMTVLRRRRTVIAWGFSLPFVIVFVLFMLVPLLSSLAMSFTDMGSNDIQTPFSVNFVGFHNFMSLFSDKQFWSSMRVTALFVLVGLPLTMAVALALAVALNKGLRRVNAFFRALFYAPVVASTIAIAVVWRYILQNDGLLNSLLAIINLQGPDWLHDTRTALPSLIVMATWRNVGTLMIIFIAGLQAIPTEVLEAASMDGAGEWTKFRCIVLPLLKPTLLLGAVLQSVSYLQFFDEPFVMTEGGPLGSTLSASYYIYEKFGFGQYGISSAASYVLFIIIAAVSALQFRLMRNKDE